MKKMLICGMLLGLLTGVGVAQRGRSGGAVSPTARPDVSMTPSRTMGASPTMAPDRTTLNRNVEPTAASPIRDPLAGKSTRAVPSGTTMNQNVTPAAAPIRDPLVDGSPTVAPNGTTMNRNVQPTAAAPIRDPK